MANEAQCALCPKKTGKRCQRCKVAFFCSTACQTFVWKTHKMICAKDDPKPSVFTQPALTDKERWYIGREFGYTPQKGRAVAATETYQELKASNMEVCNQCDGCSQCRALRKKLDKMIPALMHRYEEAVRTSDAHKELVLLRGILQKRGGLDVRGPPPWQVDEPFQVFWALAAYEFPLAVESDPTTLTNGDESAPLGYRLACNRLLRHMAVLCTVYGRMTDPAWSYEMVNLATDRLGTICKEDSKLENGEAVKVVTRGWCVGNGWELEDFLED